MKSPSSGWRQIESSLDEAMAALDPSDRSSLLLRFFENKSLREVGRTLGISEDAAQKRVSRALEQLRGRLARGGLAITTAGLAADLSAHAIEIAPAALGPTIASTAAASALPHVALHAATFTMTTVQKGLLVAGVALAVGGALFEANALRAQRAELAQLQAQNDSLAARLRQDQQAHDRIAGRLDATERRIGALAAATTPASPADATAEAEMKAWLGRVSRLKQLLVQSPEKGVPEMRLLSEADWLRGVQDANLDDLSFEIHSREDTLRMLRGQAKVRFGMMAMSALSDYVQAHGGMLPADPTDLLPFFKDNAYFKAAQVEPDMLQRYAVTYTGAVKDVPPDERNATMVEITSSDEDHDQRVVFGPRGSQLSHFTELQNDVRHALRAYAAANGGTAPSEASVLLPYFHPPLSAARQTHFLNNAGSLLPH